MSQHPEELFENAPCGLAVLDPAGVVINANTELLRLLGRTRDDVVGVRTLTSMVSVGGRIFFDTHLLPLLHLDGAVQEVALEVVRPDGPRVPVLFNARLVGAPDSAARRVHVALIEARDRRRYERDLLAATRTAEEARRASAELSTVLQQTLIPPRPPRIDGLDVVAAYRPAGDGTEVGGDFYDVFQVARDEWVLVIGDVLGKGVAAATVTSFVRHEVRAIAMQEPDPAGLLRRLDASMAAHAIDRFCSLAVARVARDADSGGWRMSGSLGGHPHPLVRTPDGRVSELGTPGSLVGLFARPSFTTFEHTVRDDVVLFYTDGVTEALSETQVFGEARLAALVAECPHDAGGVVETVVDTVLDFQHGDPHDDIAVLAVQLAPA